MITLLEDDYRKAFNIITHDSILIFQLTDRLVPCAAEIKLSSHKSLKDAILASYNNIMDNFPPDDCRTALIMADSAATADAIATVLFTEGYCKNILMVQNEEAFLKQYSFLIHINPSDFPCYPSEITSSVFLGGVGSLEERVLLQLGITSIVSVIQDAVQTPKGTYEHAVYSIEDSCSADISIYFENAIAFMTNAASQGRKILVHCHQGVSRSVSVLIAFLVASGQCESVDAALTTIQAQRPQARPNPAFMAQLYIWESMPRGGQTNSTI